MDKRIEAAANLLCIEDADVRRFMAAARRALPPQPLPFDDDAFVHAVIGMMRQENRRFAIGRARKSIGR